MPTKTKPKIEKNAGRARGKEKEKAIDPDRSGLEFWGLLLLSLCLITFVSLISEFAKGSRENPLGPFMGTWWAFAVNSFAGRLPALFLLCALATLAVKLIQKKTTAMAWRSPISLLFLFLFVTLLLSTRQLGLHNLSLVDYQWRGGYLGSFLVQTLFLPVFGSEKLGPYFICILGAFISIVWGFKISIASLVEKSTEVMGIFVYPIIDALDSLKAKRARKKLLYQSEMPTDLEADDNFKMSNKKEVRDTQAQYAIGQDDRVEYGRKRYPGEVPYGFEDLPEFSKGRSRKLALNKSEKQLEAEAELKASAFSAQDLEQTEIAGELARVNKGDRERVNEEEDDSTNFDPNDPLQVRKMRDLELERKRVGDLNRWEQEQRGLEIGGMLNNERGLPEALPESLLSRAKRVENPSIKHLDDPSSDEMRTEHEIAAKQDRVLGVGQRYNEDDINDEHTEDNGNDSGEAYDDARIVRDEANHVIVEPDDEASEAEMARRMAKLQSSGTKFPAPSLPKVKPAPRHYDDYKIPNVDDLFPDPPEQALEFTEEEVREASQHLEDQLRNFKVMGKVIQICPGPVITRYEVELAPGVKVSKIAGLENDLALALKAKRIRILAPIPGKSVVGIEVPNKKPHIVYIKDILSSEKFAREEDTIQLALGSTIAGEAFVTDLTRAPHLLIAGQTGSGKSVCINSIMASILLSRTPDEVRMLLIDPKVVELKPYDSIPHLLYPVITQPDVAVQALKWSTYEMDRRYDILAMAGVRNIKGFNQKVREGKLEDRIPEDERIIMPYLIIIIDELADLMMVAGKEVETSIARIAQKARAVGIHLILATQRPSTNVITGTIKANLPTRIAFQVASQIDARTILDKAGAEQLLGRGDMLFRPIDQPEPIRLHGAFLNDEEAETLAESASRQNVNYPQIETFNLDEDPNSAAANDEPRDELFSDAARLVAGLKQASVSLLQRRMGIGYARSGRLVDQLERAGIVGRERGSKPRDVLMASEEVESFLRSGLND